MPFVDCKITREVSKDNKEVLKKRIGEVITILGKTEKYLMVGIDDGYDLYFAGERLTKGAFVSVSLYGKATPEQYSRMTAAICDILEETEDVPKDKVYITYREVSDWGWNGKNF